ncbi:class A beta-lactamase [Variovorax fucosicus]|uniref:class A beta-lactamase n=1 Tax=Variovorax fucosicus TaxID=3053517 RepID=UPI00257565BB|nr:class A beta-lactamase [Variovorax sp. J22G47]MDM0055418.1 class A beta-lactamase [Variovorax sp. J22G47]
MKPPISRRSLLLGTVSAPLIGACAPLAAASQPLARLEADAGGRLGVMAFDTASGRQLGHRADERFAACSTFKVLAASAVLARSANDAGLLQRRVRYEAASLVNYSPITAKHVADGMTVAELCAAALQYSDNTAGNLLMTLVGGPAGVTAFARAIGDTTFRLDRWETELNTAIPGDPRDTCTPASMARNLQRLLLGDALPPAQRAQLEAWMRGNTTGAARIRAGVPAAWAVADKTGSGDYGSVNDLGVAWPPAGAPLVLAIYFTQEIQDSPMRNDVLAAAARIAAEALAS